MQSYKNADGIYNKPNPKGDKKGISSYSSPNAHEDAQLYPLDDAVSLCYTISPHLNDKKLPWDGHTDMLDMKKKEESKVD